MSTPEIGQPSPSFSIATVCSYIESNKANPHLIGSIILGMRYCKGHTNDSEVKAIRTIAKQLSSSPEKNDQSIHLTKTISEWSGFLSLPFDIRARIHIAQLDTCSQKQKIAIWCKELYTSFTRIFSLDVKTTHSFLKTSLLAETELARIAFQKESVSHDSAIKKLLAKYPKRALEAGGILFLESDRMVINAVHDILTQSASKITDPSPEILPQSSEKTTTQECPQNMYSTQQITNMKKERLTQKNFQNATQHDLNAYLTHVGQETREIYKRGSYISEGGQPVSLDKTTMKTSQEQSKVFEPTTVPKIPADKRGMYPTIIRVELLDTVSTAIGVFGKGAKNPVLLNLANASFPGGGFLAGCTAQEEELCRCSTLYNAIGENEYIPTVGEQYCRKYKTPIQKGAVIYSPQIQFFRGTRAQKYPLLEKPFQCGVISAALYDLRQGSGEDNISLEEYSEKGKETIRTILRVAFHQKHDAVVLGAIGCGAFRGNIRPFWEESHLGKEPNANSTTIPQLVSSLYKEILNEEEFKGVFKEISFGILDNSASKEVISPFQKDFLAQT